jgi:hypothetical protein
MDPVDPLTRLFRALRASGTSQGRATESSGAGQDATARMREQTPPASLEHQLRLRWSSLPEKTPKRLSETLVETVLLHELGEEHAGDPRFPALTEHEARQLLEDEQLLQDIISLSDSLR